MVPLVMIKHWNATNNTLEGALLTTKDTYLQLQDSLRNDILNLAKLNEELTSTALLQDPTSLFHYVDWLITVARASGSLPEQLIQLATTKNTLIIVREIKSKGIEATRNSKILLAWSYRRSMEEEKPCNLYNHLCEKLPVEIRHKEPKPLRTGDLVSAAALNPGNLQAVVTLVQVVPKDSVVVAALAASNES